MKIFILSLLFVISGVFSASVFASALTFDWNGSSTNWAASGSWNETGGSGDYPGSGNRTTDVVRFAVNAIYSNYPTLTLATSASITIASIEVGSDNQLVTQLTVNGGTLKVGTITQDNFIYLNSHGSAISGFTEYFYLLGTGTITAGNVFVGTGTATTTDNFYMLSDVATFNVTGNVTVNDNSTAGNGGGFRLEDGDMYLTGQVLFTNAGSPRGTNSAYFTINAKTQLDGSSTTPHLYLTNANPIPTIPTPYSSVNFYGDHGGTTDVTYTGASPNVLTTSTSGFGSGGGTIDTSKASYDNLTIQAVSGTTTVGNGALGALKVAGNLTTNTNTTFVTTGGTNTSVGGDWTNTATVTSGKGSTAITGNVVNSGTMNMSTGILEIGGDLDNSNAFNGGAGTVQVDGDINNTKTFIGGSGDITVAGSMANSKTLTMGSGDLTIGTNYTNSAGAVFTPSTGSLNFASNTAQSLIDNSTGGTVVNNVDFSGTGLKTMSGTGKFGVSGVGVLTMEAGTPLATGGILTLYSTSTSTATVAAIPSTASITGNVNVQRYISGGSNLYRGYRLLSSPINTVTTGSGTSAAHFYDLSYLPLFAPITGTTGTAGGLTKTGNPSMYLYRDNVAFTNNTFNTGNFRGINKINNSPLYNIGVDYDGTYALHAGTGILFFYRGNLTNIATKYTTTTAAEANLFVSTGALNQQDIKVVHWYTQSTTLQNTVVAGNAASYYGYNLVGNPYASSIDWNTFSATSSTAGIYGPGLSQSIYIFNETSKNYAVYNQSVGTNGGSNIIPSGQGFFVKALNTSAVPSLTFHESAKTNAQVSGPTSATAANTLLLSTAPVPTTASQYLRLNMAADSNNVDETVILFNSAAKNSYIDNEDSQYFIGTGSVGLASFSSDSVALAINTMPLPQPQQAIRLSVRATADAVYTLNMMEIKSIPAIYDIWLIDKYKNDSLDMRHNSTYAFNVALADTNSYGHNRFVLMVRQNPALDVHLLSFSGSKQSNGAELVWKTENEANYTNFTIERSTDGGKTFITLGGYVSSDIGTYSYVDVAPPVAVDLYRLKMEDLNGAITYSSVVTLNYSNSSIAVASSVSVYPNPASSVINLAITPNAATTAASYNIVITSNIGMVVVNASSTENTWQDNVSNLLPGTYIIQVVNNNDKSVVGNSKFVKL